MKKDKKYVELIRAFEKATTAKIVTLEPFEKGIKIYCKTADARLAGGWRYSTVYIPTR